MNMSKIKDNSTSVKDLIFDNKNFNVGSAQGATLINKSLTKFKFGRSILIDKNNRIIAGNKSVENAMAIGMEDVQIVESDGTKIIAVKRTDIDLDSAEGREMALSDNASAKANIVFDAELIEAEVGEAVCVEWGVGIVQQDIEEVDKFNEQVKFTIDCDNIEQLEKLQTKLNISGKKKYLMKSF